MIRRAMPEDLAAILELAAKTGLFDEPQLVELETLLRTYFQVANDRGLWVFSADNLLLGVAYCERERMTISTWNLLWIAVDPGHQRQQYGTALLAHIEADLAGLGAYQILIETSAGLPGSIAFYVNRGYQEEGRIRDFYAVGADKVVFRKVIAQPTRKSASGI